MRATTLGPFGHLRRPALLTPTVGFLAFLAAEAWQAQPSESGFGDAFIVILPVLVIANIFAFLPFLAGAGALLAVCRLVPSRLIALPITRLLVGAVVGSVVGLPFAYLLNFIPSATDGPRFSYVSMLAGSMVGGGFCALFYSPGPKATAQELGK
ncbi:MAG TPA: hypothetical protein VMZ90_12625 [Vicinamibacterales bacterium]|nr:hypothetical protein [Vicinamibacterales bacterium]